MHSQIYSLPQKYGWAAYTDKSQFLFDHQNEYKAKRSNQPIFKVKFDTFPRESIVNCVSGISPNQAHPVNQHESFKRALMFSYRTQYQSQYGPDSIGRHHKEPPPRQHEAVVNAAAYKQRTYDPPLQVIRSGVERYRVYDDDKGLYEWRQLATDPGACIWEHPRKNPFWRNGGTTKALPAPRVVRHDPVHEKERWDTIKSLDSSNRLAYGYRCNVIGYGGHLNMVEDVNSQVNDNQSNAAMESTTQATYRGLPEGFYQHGDCEMANKHKGPLSRMVTLTHPFNPFTQQSAYSNVGATATNGK